MTDEHFAILPRERATIESDQPTFEQPAFAMSSSFRIKRLFDVLVSGGLLILLLPLLFLIGTLILLDDRGPILFRQARLGQNGRPFLLYKFRTRSLLFDAHDPPLPESDPPLSRMGKYIRGTRHLEGLPQLFNVLNGDMSLIGPRPLLVNDPERDNVFRLAVRPGLTGWAQINKTQSEEQKAQLDDFYVRNWSLRQDFLILLLTGIGGSIPEVAQEWPSASELHPLATLGLGKHRYPLRRPVTPQFRDGLVRVGYLEARGETGPDALSRLGLVLHQEFQRHWLIPPHERTPDEEEKWAQLCELIDVEAYLRHNPVEESVMGRVDEISGRVLHVTLLSHSPEEARAFDLVELPPLAAGMHPGQFFEARITRTEDRIEWRTWTLRPPLRDDNQIWDEFQARTRK
jgi:lipopolysaccharide/colanic/teichoic acid biosynthesis glycosyltransferase